MRYKLNKLAMVLRDMGQEEEAEELEEMIQDFYGDWLQQLPQLASDLFEKDQGEAKQILKEKYKSFYWAGSGAFRFVIGITGDDSFVVKIARKPRGAMMNESESNKQLEFGGMFPRVHHHGSQSFNQGDPYKGADYDWIVIDKVFPIETGQELNQFFPELTNEMKAQNLAEAFISNLLGRLLHWASFNITSETNMDFLFSNSIQTYIETGKKGAEKLLEAANRDPMFRRLAMLSAKLGIDAKDIGTGNVGINSKGELMILDSSLTKDFSSSPYARS